MAGFIYARTRRWAHTSGRVRRWRERRYARFLELCRLRPDDRDPRRRRRLGRPRSSASTRPTRSSPSTSPRWRASGSSSRTSRDPGLTATRLPFADREFPRRLLELRDRARARAAAGRRSRPRSGASRALLRPDAEPLVPDRAALPGAPVPVPPRAACSAGSTALHAGLAARRAPGRRSSCSPRATCSASSRTAVIHREKVLGLTKSLMVVRR